MKIFIAILLLLISRSVFAQDNSLQDLKKTFKDERKKLRLTKKQGKKTERINRYSKRTDAKKIKTVNFDLLSIDSCFSCNHLIKKGKCLNCNRSNCTPPFDLDELDGLQIILKNVNPFNYSVNLYELQGDQINNENLSERNWNKELDLKFDKLPTLNANGLTVTKKQDVDLKKLSDSILKYKAKAAVFDKVRVNEVLANKFNNTNLKKYRNALLASATDLTNAKIDYIELEKEQATKNKGIKDLRNKKIIEFKNFTSKKTKTRTDSLNFGALANQMEGGIQQFVIDSISLISQKRQTVLRIQDKKTSRKSDSLAYESAKNDSINFYQIQKKASEQLEKYWSAEDSIRVYNVKILLNGYANEDSIRALRNDILTIQKTIREINRHIDFHNFLVYEVHSPEDSYLKIKNRIDSVFFSLFHRQFSKLDSLFGSEKDKIFSFLNKAHSTINLLEDDSNFKVIEEKLNSLETSLNAVDFTKLTAQMNFMHKMLTEENFTVRHETLSISENSDFIRYHIDFKPTSLNSLPQGKAPRFLDFTIYVRQGMKYDISSGFVADFGLKDPTYFFDKTPFPKGDSVKIGVVKGQYINPSIALFLNGYKRSSISTKIGGSFGIGLSNNSRIRLYLGPSIILGRKERVVFTGGISLGATSRLGNGYKEEQKIANTSSLPSTVPTEADTYKIGWYIGFGFNFSGRANQSFLKNLKFK